MLEASNRRWSGWCERSCTPSRRASAMIESIEPQTSEEDAALRELDAKHRRRHRWVALLSSVIVSFHTPVILFTLWHDWPLDVRVLGWLAWVGVNALVGLGMLGWSL